MISNLIWTACRGEKRCGVFEGKMYKCPKCDSDKVLIRDLGEFYIDVLAEKSPEQAREGK